MTVVRRVLFEYLENLSWDIREASVENNPLFAQLFDIFCRPLVLAADLERLSEETANRAWAQVYAQAVLVDSVVPELATLDYAGRASWLLGHPIEFATIRGIAEHPGNFRDEDEDGEGRGV